MIYNVVNGDRLLLRKPQAHPEAPSPEWMQSGSSTWFWHRVGHGLWHFIVYELHTLAGKEANLKGGKQRESWN